MTQTVALTDLQILANVAQSVTVTGVLFLAVVAFYRGDIISKFTLEKIVKSVVSEIQSSINAKLENIEKKLDETARPRW